MSQKFTVLVDLDGTIVDTAPDLMKAHNYVMKKFGYETKTTEEIRNLVGKGAGALIGRSIWGTAKKEFGKISDKKIKDEMVKDFIDYYGKNIVVESKIIDGVIEFLEWSKQNNISLAVCTNKQERLAIDLLKKIKIFDYFEYVAGSNTFDYFEYVAGSNTFDYCKPDPRHLTSVIEILQGDLKKSLMIGDSETDSAAAVSANLPFILLEDGYTDKKVNEISHDHLVTNFKGIEKIVSKYLNT